MQVIWSERAYVRRQAIEDYILYSFGFVALRNYEDAVDAWVETLKASPLTGQIEPILQNMRKEYRYFVVEDLTKGIYYVEDDKIIIVDWWDTRRSVNTLKEGL